MSFIVWAPKKTQSKIVKKPVFFECRLENIWISHQAQNTCCLFKLGDLFTFYRGKSLLKYQLEEYLWNIFQNFPSIEHGNPRNTRRLLNIGGSLFFSAQKKPFQRQPP